MLFTELEKKVPLPRSDVAKLGPTRSFGGKSSKIRKNGPETALEKTYFLHLLLQFWALKPDFLAISRQK